MKGQERTTRIGNRSQPVDEAAGPAKMARLGDATTSSGYRLAANVCPDEVRLVSVQRMT
jgi:hypothetical protein